LRGGSAPEADYQSDIIEEPNIKKYAGISARALILRADFTERDT
jgi:hypothetical protein